MYINFLILKQGDGSPFSMPQTFAISLASMENAVGPRLVARLVFRGTRPFTVHYSKHEVTPHNSTHPDRE